MKDWFWFIARGGVVTVELTVISIVFACILALFGSLGRLSKKMTFRQAWDRYQSWGYMWRMVLGRIPYWVATFYTSLFRGTPLLLQIIAIYQVIPEIIRALRPAGHATTRRPSGRASRRCRSTTAPTSPRCSAPASRRCPRARTRPPGPSA